MATRNSILAGLIPVGVLLAVVLGAVIVRGRPMVLLGVVLGVMLLVPVAWVVVSALWPARADRACPECGHDTLVRRDPASTVGLECTRCGWCDETASSWLLAEEEGPLEDVVLRQRAKRSPVDNPDTVDTVDMRSRGD